MPPRLFYAGFALKTGCGIHGLFIIFGKEVFNLRRREYQKVKGFTYLEYCDYLQSKYGIGRADYMTKSYNKNSKVSRTKDGLFAHHKKEDTAIMLSNPKFAEKHPFEWQQKENIIYCDYLEHLLLHVLICKYPNDEAEGTVGLGGIVDYLVPELNDLYSGWIPETSWKKNCFNMVSEDEEVYLLILKQLIDIWGDKPIVNNDDYTIINMFTGEPEPLINMLYSSYNNKSGTWDASKNMRIYNKIKSHSGCIKENWRFTYILLLCHNLP